MKLCTRKKHMIPLHMFYPRGDDPRRLSSWCKHCQIEASNAWQKANRARKSEYQRQYRAA